MSESTLSARSAPCVIPAYFSEKVSTDAPSAASCPTGSPNSTSNSFSLLKPHDELPMRAILAWEKYKANKQIKERRTWC